MQLDADMQLYPIVAAEPFIASNCAQFEMQSKPFTEKFLWKCTSSLNFTKLQICTKKTGTYILNNQLFAYF